MTTASRSERPPPDSSSPATIAPDAERLTTLRTEVREFLFEARRSGMFEPMCDGWAIGFSREFSAALGARGWVGMTIPKEYGGAGATFVERVVVAEELLAVGAPVTAHWVAERQIAPSILRHGSPEIRTRILPQIAAGTCVFSLGLSEPNSGSDLASVRTRAERAEDGWLLNGSKIWTSHAHRADYVAVLCRTDRNSERHAGLSQIVVPTNTEGLTIRPIATLSAPDTGDFCEVTFEDVLVDHDMLLGREGTGWAQVVQELAFERNGPERYLSTFPLLGAVADGDLSAEAIRAVGHLVADLVPLRELSYATARDVDNNLVQPLRAAIAKDGGNMLEQQIPERLRGVFDASTTSPPATAVDRLMVDAILNSPSFTLRGGTTEILRSIISRQLLESA